MDNAICSIQQTKHLCAQLIACCWPLKGRLINILVNPTRKFLCKNTITISWLFSHSNPITHNEIHHIHSSTNASQMMTLSNCHVCIRLIRWSKPYPKLGVGVGRQWLSFSVSKHLSLLP